MSSPAFLPLVMMSIVAPIGAVDVLYFHIWKFRLHARAESRAETATHIVRELLMAVVVFLLANYEPRGGWFLIVAAAMAFDVVNNVADVALEPASRARVGGLPRAEYVIHIIGATAGGAFSAGYVAVALGLGLATAPTLLGPAHGLPSWLVWNANALAVGSVALAVLEAFLLVRALPRRGVTARDEAT